MTTNDDTPEVDPPRPAFITYIEHDLVEMDNPDLDSIQQLEHWKRAYDVMYAQRHIKVGNCMHEKYSFAAIAKVLAVTRQAISKMYGSGADADDKKSDESKASKDPKPIKLRLWGLDGEVTGYADQMHPDEPWPFKQENPPLLDPGWSPLEDLLTDPDRDGALLCPELDLLYLAGEATTEVAA